MAHAYTFGVRAMRFAVGVWIEPYPPGFKAELAAACLALTVPMQKAGLASAFRDVGFQILQNVIPPHYRDAVADF
jgi:hypothetical protein